MPTGNNMKILPISPYFSERPWGSHRLFSLKGLPASLEQEKIYGESWEVSTLREGLTSIGEKNLLEFLQRPLPYVVKLISTSMELSVQVHPNDEYAYKEERELGKNECWVILNCQPDSGIYLGFRKEFLEKYKDDEAKLKQDFFDGLFSLIPIDEILNFYPVRSGDYFFIPAGTVHAIGKNIDLIEFQSASGLTYRIWDWDRTDSKGNKRELHLKKSMDVLNFSVESNQLTYFQSFPNIYQLRETQTLYTNFSDSRFQFQIHFFCWPKNFSSEEFTEKRKVWLQTLKNVLSGSPAADKKNIIGTLTMLDGGIRFKEYHLASFTTYLLQSENLFVSHGDDFDFHGQGAFFLLTCILS